MNKTTETFTLLETCRGGDVVKNYYHAYSYEKYFANDVLLLVVNATITVTTIFLNSLTVLAYWKCPQLKKTLSYFLIMILSCIDLPVGVICNSVFTAFILTRSTGNGICELYFFTLTIITALSGMSVAVLSTMSFERYLGIVHPFFHRTKLTKKRLLPFATFVWCQWILALCFSFVNKNWYRLALIPCALFFILFTLFTYVRILLVGRRSVPSIHESSFDRSSTEISQLTKQKFLQDKKLARSCVYVIICHFMCQVPSLAPIGLLLFGVTPDHVIFARGWAVSCFLSNSSLNSVLFFWMNRRLKSEAVKILKHTIGF